MGIHPHTPFKLNKPQRVKSFIGYPIKLVYPIDGFLVLNTVSVYITSIALPPRRLALLLRFEQFIIITLQFFVLQSKI